MNSGGKSSALDSFNEIATIRIELRDTDPVIWRQVEVPTSVTLKVLHDIVQIVMGWFDHHLWEFRIGRQQYRLPMDEELGTVPRLDASKVRLRDGLRPQKTTIDYLYDFGDCWEHRLTVTNVRQGEPGIAYPRYIGGEWNAPPEDCGGISGFYDTLDALTDPNHPNHAEIKEWFDDYDPTLIDDVPIKYGLSRIANQRNAARARLNKRNPAQHPSHTAIEPRSPLVAICEQCVQPVDIFRPRRLPSPSFRRRPHHARPRSRQPHSLLVVTFAC